MTKPQFILLKAKKWETPLITAPYDKMRIVLVKRANSDKKTKYCVCIERESPHMFFNHENSSTLKEAEKNYSKRRL